MFSTQGQLRKRTPQNGTDRESFLSLLVDEYLHSTSFDAKLQVLANLVNFAYDPINFKYIRDVGVLDIFIYIIKNDTDGKLLHFAIAGICNLCLDPLNAEYILNHLGLKPITALLNSSNTKTKANTITTLIYLCNEMTKSEMASPEVIKVIQDIKLSGDKILTNLATVFLEDVCNQN